MKTLDWYDRQGNPITIIAAADRILDPFYRLVARDIWDDAEISTIWVGLAHGVDDDNRPLIFSTRVIGGAWDGHQWHWATEAEAVVGHDRISAELLTKIEKDEKHDQPRRTSRRHRNVHTHRRRH